MSRIAATASPSRPEPVSPELVLVDPELAAIERRRLAESETSGVLPGRAQSDPAPAREPTRPTAMPAAERPATAGPPARRSGRAVRRAAVALGLGVVAGAIFTAVHRADNSRDDTTGSAAARRTVSTRSNPRTARGSPTRSVREQKRTRPRHQESAPLAGGRRRTSRRNQDSRASRPKSRSRVRATGAARARAISKRVFVWVPVQGAAYYDIRFFRGRREIYAAVTAAPRLSLPARWTYRGARFSLSAGRYRWIVRPGFGGVSKHAYGREIVRSTFVVRAPPG